MQCLAAGDIVVMDHLPARKIAGVRDAIKALRDARDRNRRNRLQFLMKNTPASSTKVAACKNHIGHSADMTNSSC
jgi:hypothetical protein